MNAFLRNGQSAFVRRALFQVHLWAGMLAGVYLFVVCVSGAALVFRIELQRALHPQLFTASTSGPQADAATVMEAVRDAYPNGRLSGVDAPTTARDTYLAYVTHAGTFSTILVDPVTATVLGELPDNSLVRTIQDLHFDLLAGRTGRVVNGAGAFVLLTMSLTGFVIWWPGTSGWRRGFVVDFSRNWRRVNWDLHSAVGIWTVLFIAMWATTGIYFAFPSQFRSVVTLISPITVSRPPTSSPPAGLSPRPSWRELIDGAQTHVPNRFVARVVTPSTERGAFLVMFADVQPTPVGTSELTPVYMDPYTGAVLRERPSADRTAGDLVMAWVSPLHVGSFGGLGVKVLWLVFGLAPPLLFATGLVMWWTRVVRPRWGRARWAPNPRSRS